MDIDNIFFNTEDYNLTSELLGKGSFGSVYIVLDEHNKEYAAKIIDINDGFNGNQQMMFLRESLILHKLDHPAIVKFKGINFRSFDKTELQPTIITEYLTNRSLRFHMEQEKKLQAKNGWTSTVKSIILLGVADAMCYLHQKGILHLDLKPENILIDENFYPRVCDFGLSRCLPEKYSESVKLTIKGQLGTPFYMAPEILREENEIRPSVDVYSFGILAYELITGEKPFGNISIYDYTHKILNRERPKFPKTINKNIKGLISRCWSEERENRPSFDEIFQVLSENVSLSTDEDFFEKDIKEYIEILNEEKEISLEKESGSLSSKFEKSNKTRGKKDFCIFTNIFIMILFFWIICQSLLIFILKNSQNNVSIEDDYFFIGLNKLLGVEDERNLHEAKMIFKELSEKGSFYSSYILGLLFQSQDDEEQDFNKSFSYYMKSFQQNNVFASVRIGQSYFNGYGVTKNFEKAIEYYTYAADLRNSNAFNSIGYCYYSGKGVDKNITEAIKYFELAASLGNIYAMLNLANINEMVLKKFTKAIEYYGQAAKLGNSDAMHILGNIYSDGILVAQNITKAIELYEESANLGNSDALNSLGYLFEVGKGFEKNYTKAFEYFQKAAKLRNIKALINLALCYENGNGVEKNYTKAIQYYKLMASQGIVKAINYLGICYEEGNIVEKNYTKAIEYFEQAAKLGYPNSMYCLGLVYEYGKGVNVDINKAIEYYQMAAKLGHIDAKGRLEALLL